MKFKSKQQKLNNKKSFDDGSLSHTKFSLTLSCMKTENIEERCVNSYVRAK